MRRGLFITFEGPEGAGKTTVIRAVAEHLRQRGYNVVLTREPGGTPIGDQIRTVLLSPDNNAMHPETELLLFSAARAQHVRERILPALEEGAIVLCDRFADSTLAYQGYGRGLDLPALHAITQFATGGLTPDLTILLDIDPAQGLARRRAASAQGAEWNRIDNDELALHQRVREGYLRLAAENPERWVVVDASAPVDDVIAQVIAAIEEHLKKKA
ncbi:dTMP kinase [Ardenticatena maritima]|uniref:Thymidylate kinase n=1 Tax=Ardenticatena maritima TaxID=872965 RepID=A0A0M8K621_9CHLR|nr:dTMP kinase [Ardenticatena maritima]KPL87609.1 thymidylate kinase [Ardenticatena maritima]GAP62495.1 dTMP kinase [Ardenticatena maritima]